MTATAERTLKLLCVDETRGFGGAVTALAAAIPHLISRGFEVHVVLAAEDERSQRTLANVTPHVDILPFPHRPTAVKERLIRLDRYGRLLKWPYLATVMAKEYTQKAFWLVRLARLLRRVRPDVISGNNGPLYNGGAMLLAWVMGLPTVVVVRSVAQTGWLARLVERICREEVFVSEYLLNAAQSRCRNPVVIYDGLDETQWPPPSSHSAMHQPIRVGHLGMFTPFKGQDVFLKAAAIVQRATDQVAFCLFGDVVKEGSNPYADQVRALAAVMPRPDQVCFAGFRSDVRQAILEIDVLVQSSTATEALSMVVMEGMAAGRAVIASDDGGPRELIEHGASGLLVPPRDSAALAGAILDLVRHPERIQELGHAARRRFEERFTVVQAADSLANLYRRAMRS